MRIFYGQHTHPNRVVNDSVRSGNSVTSKQACVCEQNICDTNTSEVQNIKIVLNEEHTCSGRNQGITAGKHNTKNTSEDTTIYDPCFTLTLPHTHTIKIFHQNIRSLRNKTDELLCHLNLDPPYLSCITEHHLHHDELASLHIENYTLGATTA